MTPQRNSYTVPGLTFMAWWPRLNDLLLDKDLGEAGFAVARDYFEQGLTPQQAFETESAVQARMVAA